MSGADIELMSRRELRAGPKGYLAEHDGPDLVALALAAPQFGEPLLQQYVALHAAYGYREYRQGSLWALLDAVLQHPNQEWVLAWVSALGAAVLAPNRGEFREGLGLAALALQVAAGEPGATQALDGRRDKALLSSHTEDPLPATNLVIDPTSRGQGDTWGTNRRRLAALAEALSRVPGQQAAVETVIQRALELRWGFAGFNAPACLALADAIEVSSPNPGRIVQSLESARTSAHNIQDATFCVRTTARVEALAQRWWPQGAGAFDVRAAAERLTRDASAPEFAAAHVVGQPYDRRDPQSTIALPAEVRTARTPADLARIYQRPLDDFQRLNMDLPQPADPIPAGKPVNVPDPGFPPLLAARIAARTLADAALPAEQQQRVIRGLVPVAAADTTALDLVLARLLLASRSPDRAMLANIVALAARSEATVPADQALSANLTRFVP